MFVENESPITLIVGADSLIGGALMAHLQQAGEPVVGTTRRPKAVDESHLYLDLTEGVDGWRCLWPIAVAIVCAGVTKLDACRREPVATTRVNVQGVCALVENLVARGAFVIYLSSNQVFDGSVPYRLPDDPVSPVTEYGRQKAEAEHQISQWGDSVAIVRFTKVLGPTDPLFSEWVKALQNGETIRPFSDMYMAPVPLSCAVSVLRLVAILHLSGILQVSGERDISYAEVAYLGARMLGVAQTLVQPVEASQSGCYTEPVPANTTLNIDRLKSALGIAPPDVRWTIEMAFMNSQASDGAL